MECLQQYSDQGVEVKQLDHLQFLQKLKWQIYNFDVAVARHIFKWLTFSLAKQMHIEVLG